MEVEHREAVEKVIDFLDLQQYRDSFIVNLPYGVRKVTELARALCSDPKLLLLDEPSSGLNVEETEDMAFWIEDIKNLLGITVLMVEHDMKLVVGGVRPGAARSTTAGQWRWARCRKCSPIQKSSAPIWEAERRRVRAHPQGQQPRNLLRADHGHSRGFVRRADRQHRHHPGRQRRGQDHRAQDRLRGHGPAEGDGDVRRAARSSAWIRTRSCGSASAMCRRAARSFRS